MANGKHPERTVISVGGSLIVPPTGINTKFLTKLNSFVRDQLAKDPTRQFFLVSGGGTTARHYRDAGRDVIKRELSNDDLDWLGIHATRLNAHLLRTIFRDIAHLHIIEHYDIIRKATEPVIVASGWKPGWSTDYCAVLLAEDYDFPTVINLSNIPQVFDKDPNQFSDAKPLAKLSWPEFRMLIGDTWSPGMNAPFDPIAAKKAEEVGTKVVILNGEDFTNLDNFSTGKPFVGTVIE
jgi:uridylate kinase